MGEFVTGKSINLYMETREEANIKTSPYRSSRFMRRMRISFTLLHGLEGTLKLANSLISSFGVVIDCGDITVGRSSCKCGLW
jgi:hypothetical protein